MATKKKAAKAKKSVRSLGAKPLTAKEARKGGTTLMQACATGTHMKEATITH